MSLDVTPQRRDEHPQPLVERIGDDVRLPDAAVAAGLLVQPAGDAVEEIARPLAALPDLLLGVGQLVMHQQPAVGPVVVQLSQRVFDLPAGHFQAQMFAGDGLDRVGLVEDHHFVIRAGC